MAKSMKIRRAIVVGGVVASLALAPAAMAKNDKVPGTPGAPNCAGQSIAWALNGYHGLANGVGGIAEFRGQSVQELQAEVDAFCAAP